ncbi:MAG: hypothetical protein ABSH13_15030 [Candidatus Acidiferrum sp.]|jgi:hypothetical protein
MTTHNRHLLEVLKAELEFLEKGGYRHPVRAAWRPQFIFQDSLTCVNLDPTKTPRPCSECALIDAVPAEARDRKFPCRYIPLNETGETLDSLYRSGTQEEIEATLAKWLKAEIVELTEARSKSWSDSERPVVHVQARFVDKN